MVGIHQIKQYMNDVNKWLSDISNLIKNHRQSFACNEELQKLSILLNKKIEDITADDLVQINHYVHTIQFRLNTMIGASPEEHREVKSVPIGEHTLPPLPYDYHALEPYISREIMRLHHD